MASWSYRPACSTYGRIWTIQLQFDPLMPQLGDELMPNVGAFASGDRSYGIRPLASWYDWMASASCLMLFWHLLRLADSRTFWMAGRSRPIRMAMIAITTSNSIRVKPGLRPRVTWDMKHLRRLG